jgi:cytochrome c oxidase assembly protein subunit 11
MDRKRANRKLLGGLLIMTAGSFAFGWALVPLYDVLCKVAGIGNAEAKAGAEVVTEAIDPNREVTIEFVTSPASVGSYEFRPAVASMKVHPGKLYDTSFYAKNLTALASVAQAVPSISPAGTAKYFHKTECFCFSPQKFAAGEGRDMPVRFIVD